MRIIGGKHKGKTLKTFSGDAVRPTSDRARESLFNILSFQIQNKTFLDLCSGTGAIGLEAISRGVSSAVFVDASKDSLKITEFNLNACKEKAETVLSSAVDFLKTTNKKFDIIFFDPPYINNDILEVLTIVKTRKILNGNGLFVYEHKADKPSSLVEGYEIVDTRKYGIAIFDFYKEKL